MKLLIVSNLIENIWLIQNTRNPGLTLSRGNIFGNKFIYSFLANYIFLMPEHWIIKKCLSI